MVIDKVNKGTGTTTLKSSTSKQGSSAFWAHATANPATATTIGVTGRSDASRYGVGVQGTAPGAGSATGVLGVVENTLLFQPVLSGVHGVANTGYGVIGESNSGQGVFGIANAASGSNAIGVYGQSQSTGGQGVYGYALYGIGVLCGVGYASAKPLVAQGATGQSANLQEWQNNAGTALSVVSSVGHLGLGMSAPAHLIHLNGGAYCDGTGAWIAGSSVRWKENIAPLTDGMKTLKQLHPVSYNRKETPGKTTMGFIAEEVGKVLPTVVDWDRYEAGYAEGYDHLAILALAVEAIKELNQKLQTENSTLRARIDALEREFVLAKPA